MRTHFISVAVPLSNRVSDKVKKQIWGNEYVYFAFIIHNSTSDDDQYTFKVQNRKGGQPTFSLEQSIKKQPFILSINGRLLFKHSWLCIQSVSLQKQPN